MDTYKKLERSSTLKAPGKHELQQPGGQRDDEE